MRIGLVGTGRIGASHAATLRDLPRVASVTLTDVDASRAARVAGELGVGHAPDMNTLLRNT